MSLFVLISPFSNYGLQGRPQHLSTNATGYLKKLSDAVKVSSFWDEVSGEMGVFGEAIF